MSNKIYGLLMFSFGATVGSAITWKYLKGKYEALVQAEIDSVKEAFSDKTDKEARDSNGQKKEMNDYTDVIKDHGYVSKEEMFKMKDTPYVIAPDKFGEIPEYDSISLTYYADGVITDDEDEELTDVEGTIGYDALSHFGEYEDDSVFVRNDRLKCDYEILMDSSPYRKEYR